MSEIWSGLNPFTKLELIFVIPAFFFLFIVVITEYLKFSDRNIKYKPPRLVSLMNLLIYIVAEGSFAIVYRRHGMSVLASSLLGITTGLAVAVIIWFVTYKLSVHARKEVIVEYEQLVGCSGTVIKQISKYGGSVCINYKDRFIESSAVSEEIIPVGEEVKITATARRGLVCKRIK